MPVQVRCSGCEHVISAPDRARGKAVRCPECGKAVRVPEEKAAPAAKTAKKAASRPPSSSQMIASLDLDRLQDSETRICPKCSAEVSAEDTECPECGVDLVTGVLSAKRQAVRDRKGPDTKKYYSEFFSDSLEFWRKNKKLSISLCLNSLTFVALGSFCILVSIWCAKPLARVFWLFMATIAFLIPPGLAWNLHTTIIDATLRKKKKLPKYHFDKLLGAALGLKLIFWFLDVAAPLHILALVFLALKFWYVALGMEVGAVVFASLLFPLAMSHMAMPITLRGWLVNKMSGPFFRTLPALAYWAMFAAMLMVVPAGCVAGGAIASGTGLADLFRDSSFNSMVVVKQAELADYPKNAIPPEDLREWQGKKVIDLNWNPFWIPAGLFVIAAGFFGATAVLLMRANGLYSRYFLDYLDLETMEREVKYVPKAANIDQLEAKKGLTLQMVFAVLGLAGVFAFAFGGAGATIQGKSFLIGVGTALLILGIITTLVGHFWLLFEAFQDSMAWFGALSLSTTFGGAAFPFVGPLGFLLTPLLSLVYGFINWSQAKYPLVVELVGFFVYLPLGIVLLAVGIGTEFLGLGGGGAE